MDLANFLRSFHFTVAGSIPKYVFFFLFFTILLEMLDGHVAEGEAAEATQKRLEAEPFL